MTDLRPSSEVSAEANAVRFDAMQRCGVRSMTMDHTVEFLWFAGCPNHARARTLLDEVLAELAPGTLVTDIDATDPEVAVAHRFPGSPTIRVDGRDVDPGFVDPGDYTPRCRLFRTERGLTGVPERRWVEQALR